MAAIDSVEQRPVVERQDSQAIANAAEGLES
jgi:hypothetical protein